MTFKLYHGDCRETLLSLPDNSVDSIVTDPPYGLSFMGHDWDKGVPGIHFWQEMIRVLKPGGHLLSFAGSRTYHRMVVNIEDAGFEIRDQIMWVYGSGFPKSMDVSKAIDKARTEDIEPVRVICRVVRAAMDARGLKSRDLTDHFGSCDPRLIDHWAARDTDSQPSLPTWEQWQKLRDVLGIGDEMDAEVWRLNGRKGQPSDTWQNADIIGEHGGQTPGFVGQRFTTTDNKIRDLSDAARQWSGWGTALKPAHEPICVARKPLAHKTVAANVLAHGTGAMNIDACRVELQGAADAAEFENNHRVTERLPQSYDGEPLGLHDGGWKQRVGEAVIPTGRWPANLIHDGSDEVVAAFPDAKGQQGVTGKRTQGNTYGSVNEDMEGIAPRIEGGQSSARFFYCAKASRKDRNEGCEGIQASHTDQQNKLCGAIQYRNICKKCKRVLKNSATECCGVAPERIPSERDKRENNHPTVKPTDLMRYLCRLVTPPNGLVLDPFMGSGSTGKAAMLEGFRFIGCEFSDEYIEIARLRILAAQCEASGL